MRKKTILVLGTAVLAGILSTAAAHFQILVPSTDIVDEPGEVSLDILFSHPMEGGPVMEMGAPRRFGVLVKGEKRIDLRKSLE